MEYSYKDIYLLPKYSYLKSRSEADTRIRFGKYKFRIPVMLANMKTVINEELAEWLAINNYFYVMHRFGVDQIEFCKRMEDKGLITSISVGVKDESVKQVEQLANEGITPDFVTIDIAHGHSGNMERMIEVVQKNLKNTFLIVGNVCTGEAVEFLQNLGVKCIKVGVGPGCFGAGTKILMSNGFYKNIEEVKENDYVINMHGKPVRVKRSFCTGIKKVIKLRHNSHYNYTYVTPDHNYFIGDLSTVNSKTLSKSSYRKLLNRDCRNGENKFDWHEISKFDNQYMLTFPKTVNFELPNDFELDLNKYRINKNGYTNYSKIKSSYELGYLFGCFLGDGTSHIAQNKRKKSTIGAVIWSFHISEDKIAEKLASCVETLFGRKAKINKKQSKNIILVNLYCKPLAHFFKQFGKRQNKHLPEEYLCNNKEYLLGLKDGLIDSDGYCEKGKDKRITFKNTSKKLLDLWNTLSIIQNSYPASFTKLEKSPGKLINCNLNHLHEASRGSICPTFRKRIAQNFYLVQPLEKIEDTDIYLPVYDLEIDDESHSFIANNVIVHNSVCLTKKQTGFSRPQFSAVLECASVAKVPIIADGGIEYNGDITKALVAGAQMVMIGNLAAGFDESPGKKVIYPDGRIVKEYFGSASEYNKKEKEYIEGRKIEIPYRGSIKDKLREIEQSLKSSISYAGGENLNAFLNINWVSTAN